MAEKIKLYDLNVCFSDYKGGKDYINGSNFIREKFVKLNENPKKMIYPHITNATDTKNIERVFDATRDIFLHDSLEESGFGI